MDILSEVPEDLREPTEAWLSTKSKSTQGAYSHDLSVYLRWCREGGIDPRHVTKTQATRFKGELMSRMVDSSVGRKLAAISSWYDELLDAEDENDNPLVARNVFKKLERPKAERTVSKTRFFSLEEMRDLLYAADHVKTPQSLRNAALVRLMLILGIRVGEVISLKTTAISVTGGKPVIRVRGKGRVMTERRLPESVGRALHAYFEAVPHEGYMFITESGAPLDAREVTQIIRRLARAAGIRDEYSVTPHVTRHSFGTQGKRVGATREQLQRAMGHADARTTDLYAHAEDDLDGDPALLLEAALAY